MDKQQDVVISDFEQTMSEQCMACCGATGSSKFIAADCPVPSCFSDAYMSIMEPSPCQSLYLIQNGYIVDPAAKQIDQLRGRNFWNTGVINNYDHILEYDAGFSDPGAKTRTTADTLARAQMYALREEFEEESPASNETG